MGHRQPEDEPCAVERHGEHVQGRGDSDCGSSLAGEGQNLRITFKRPTVACTLCTRCDVSAPERNNANDRKPLHSFPRTGEPVHHPSMNDALHLRTHLCLLGRGAGGAARARDRLREARRDADEVRVLRVLPLGQGEGGVPVVDAAVDVLAPG